MRKILLTCFMLVFVLYAWAQDRTVSGKVTDSESGEGLPGVNVLLKGTGTGVNTDLDGNYKISVPSEGGALVFTFIGMQKEEVEIGSRSVIDIQMVSDIQQLSEVVVTASGQVREKKALGYSVENVDGDKVSQVSEPDPLRALQGKVAGVQIGGSSGAPGSATRITIRGNSSLLGNNQPLFVVDGIPYDNSQNSTYSGAGSGIAPGSRISDLDPNNIESINVLKGGAAAALYGSRAANGVILITTKTGSTQASKEGMEVAISSTTAFEQIANLPNFQNTYGTGADFAYQQANGSWGSPFPGTRPYATDTEIPHWYDGVRGFENLWGTTVPYQAYPDNAKDLFRTGLVLDNSVTISTGNEKSSLTFTGSQLNNQGYVPNTYFNKTSLSVGGTSFLENGIIVGGNISYTKSERRSVQSGAGSVGGNNPSAFARALYLGRNWDVHGQPHTNPADKGSAFMVGRGQADNPLWSYENAGGKEVVDRLAASFNIGYDVNDWLNVTYRGGVNQYNQVNNDWLRPGSTGPSSNPGVGQFTDDRIGWEELNGDLLIKINRDLNEQFSFNATLGHNVNQRTRTGQAYRGLNYVTFDIDDIDNTNDVVPIGRGFSQRRLIGVYGDAFLGYNDYLFLTLTARNDWSSTLPKDNRSFFYPAAAVSFILSEALDISSDALNSIKLRGGLSQVGSDTDPYQLQAIYNVNFDFVNVEGYLPFTPTGGSTVPGAFLSATERDPNLKPEITTEIELGTDIALMNNRINLAATVYDRLSENQIAPISLASETGFNEFFTNFGAVRNRGIELTLNLGIVNNRDGFNWDFTGTFTHNRNTIDNLGDIDEVFLGTPAQALLVQAVHRPGEEYGLLYGSTSARDDEGNLLIDPSNGQLIRNPELQVIGNPNPDFNAGFINTFSFKGITLNAVIDWRQGGDFYSNTIESMLGRGVLAFQADRETNRVIPGVYGDVNNAEPYRTQEGEKVVNTTMVDTNDLYFGETFASNGASEWNVYDGTTYRLREVSLSYNLPKSLLSKTPFGSASIGVTGRNLFYWAPNVPKDSNFDPETNSTGNTNLQGQEVSATPTVKRYAFNLRFTF